MGTTFFEAPEVFFDKPKTLKSDIYSVGMIMYELLYPSLSHPWATTFHTGIPETIRAAIENAVKSGKRPPVEETSTYTALMQLCWDQNSEKRPSSNDFNLAIIQIEVNNNPSNKI
jgi:serine/threonine protein kinase